MDPTKPILTLHENYQGCFYRDVASRNQPPQQDDKLSKLEQQKNFYKEQYQRLYREYEERGQQEAHQLKEYIRELEQKVMLMEKTSNHGSSSQLRHLRQKNEQLSQILLRKNYELEEAYKRAQHGGAQYDTKRMLTNVDRLEDGVRQAIYSNYELLRNNSINEIKNLLRQNVQTTTTRQFQIKTTPRQ